MAGTMQTGGRSRTISAINVTPLVDVMLVLLVILMVASSYIVAQTMKVQLPKAHATDGTADKPSKVELLKDGGITEDDERNGLKKVQDTTDKAVSKVDEILAKKESEILEV